MLLFTHEALEKSARAVTKSCDVVVRVDFGTQTASGLGRRFHQNCSGIEQLESLTLNILLRYRAGLRRHDSDVAPRAASVGKAMLQQRCLHAAAAVSGQGAGTAELRDAVCDAHTSRAGDFAISPGDGTGQTRRSR